MKWPSNLFEHVWTNSEKQKRWVLEELTDTIIELEVAEDQLEMCMEWIPLAMAEEFEIWKGSIEF